MFNNQLSKAIEELDKVLAFLGLLISLFITIWLGVTGRQFTWVVGGSLAFIACLVYLLLRKRLSSPAAPFLARTEVNSKFYMVLNILFFTLLSCNIILLYLRPELYVRPLSYFIITALMVTLIGIEILFLPCTNSRIYLTLFKIILVSLSLVYSQILIFPSVVGTDPWSHQLFVNEILSAGHIPEGWAYSKLPVMHLISTATCLITGLDYKLATMLSIGLLNVVCTIPFIFLLGRLIWNDKVGLLAALLLGVANHYIQMGYWSIPNTLGLTLIPLIIYLLLKVKKGKPTTNTCLSLLMMAILILTHTLTSMYLAILLFAFGAGFHIYRRIYRRKLTIALSLNTAITFTVGMFAWWIYASGFIVDFAHIIRWAFEKESMAPVTLVATQAPLPEQLFSYLGMLLFFTTSFIGILYMVSKKFGNLYSFVVAIGVIVLFGIWASATLTGTSDLILAHRWISLNQVMLAIPLGSAVLLIHKVVKHKLIGSFLLPIFILLLAFFMVITPQANQDNRTFCPNIADRSAFTHSEIQAVQTISNTCGKTIGTDWYYCIISCIVPLDTEITPISKALLDGDFSHCQDMLILVREEIVKHPFLVGGTVVKLNYDPCLALGKQGFSCIYSCGSVKGFINPEGEMIAR